MALTNQTPEKDVNDLFTRVAPKYDLMNNVISLGLQKKWRRIFIEKISIKDTDQCLDLCCGTGDSTLDLVKSCQHIVGLDFNEAMLKIAGKKSKAKHLDQEITWLKADAMNLPFEDDTFDLVTICFGLRNVPDAGKTIAEAYRVLRPNGKFAILEMSQPTNPVIKLGWQVYFKLFPYFAKLTHNQVADYQYLSRTSKAFLSAEQLKRLLEEKGFQKVVVSKLTWGAGAIHIGIKDKSI